MEKLYASAIERLLTKGVKEDAVMKNLMAHLKEKGRVKLLPSILRALKTSVERTRITGSVVEVAHKADGAHALREAKIAGIDAEAVVVNEALLSGWRGRAKGVLVDRSGKRALTDLYQRIVKV